tara:strand:+ start:1047 stop:1448 length:402 start_codon:yes stop_codon:yes gene_type:complete
MPQVTAKSSVDYRVPYADTDQMGFVYYANFLVYFERVRNEILRDLGVPYVELEERGVILPVTEAHCDYKLPAKYDDVIQIVGWAEIVSKTRIKCHAEVHRGDEVLATGYTIHACLSSETLRPVRVPADIVGES